jgi:hypothetical protein
VKRCRPTAALWFVVVAVLAPAGTAAAQDTTSSTEVEAPKDAHVSLDIGDFNSSLGDWPVEALEVTGDMEADTEFTIFLKSTSGTTVFTATAKYTPPTTKIPVSSSVGVGDVASVEFSSSLLAGSLIAPELEEQLQGGGGSTGQVATSMALVMIVAVILFRTPLPAAATQRWTK